VDYYSDLSSKTEFFGKYAIGTGFYTFFNQLITTYQGPRLRS